MSRGALFGKVLGASLALYSTALIGFGAGCVTTDEGRRMQQQLDELKERSMKVELGGVQLADKVQAQSQELQRLISEAKRLTTTMADTSQKNEALQTDLMQAQGKFDDLQRQLDSLQKQFTEWRGQTDTKLDQINNQVAPKATPLPENPDQLFAEGAGRVTAQKYAEARRYLDAFVSKYATDARAAKAQYLIGEAYYSEGKFANAIASFTKVVENFSKSEEVEGAMFKNGQAFLQLRYCTEAKTYFQELIRRYPKTRFKNEAGDQIKEITKKAKDKTACQS